MAATRNSLRAKLEQRLGDTANAVWTDDELDDLLDEAIQGLYPSFYQRKVDTSTASAGPVQNTPLGVRNLYYVGYQRTGSNRVRSLRAWKEGYGQAYVPKTGIAGDTLVWAWTEGWEAPSTGTELLTFPPEAGEVVILRAQIGALEGLLSNKVKQEKFYSLTVRPSVTEDDILSTMEALHASVNARLDRVMPLPEIEGQ